MLGDTSQNSCDFDLSNLEIAVLIPCYNEEAAIPKVIADFRVALPQSTILFMIITPLTTQLRLL